MDNKITVEDIKLIKETVKKQKEILDIKNRKFENLLITI